MVVEGWVIWKGAEVEFFGCCFYAAEGFSWTTMSVAFQSSQMRFDTLTQHIEVVATFQRKDNTAIRHHTLHTKHTKSLVQWWCDKTQIDAAIHQKSIN